MGALAEYEFALSPNIGSYDDFIATLEAGADNLQLFEGCRVVGKVFALTNLSHNKLERLWNDGKFLCFVSAIAILFGH